MILPFVMTFTKTVIMSNAMSDSILTFLSMFWQCITTELVSFKILLNSHSSQIIFVLERYSQRMGKPLRCKLGWHASPKVLWEYPFNCKLCGVLVEEPSERLTGRFG